MSDESTGAPNIAALAGMAAAHQLVLQFIIERMEAVAEDAKAELARDCSLACDQLMRQAAAGPSDVAVVTHCEEALGQMFSPRGTVRGNT
jgi:hypothetical protein